MTHALAPKVGKPPIADLPVLETLIRFTPAIRGDYTVASCPARVVTALSLYAGTASLAWSAETTGSSQHTTSILVAQIVVLLTVGRLFGEGMQRIGQPAIMGQLLAGVVLGPTVFGAIAPSWQAVLFPRDPVQQKMLDALSQFGILLLLLLTGMETRLRELAAQRRAAIAVSASGIVIPFALGFAIGWSLPDWMVPDPTKRIVTTLFLGTTLSIASVKIVAAVVQEMNFGRRRVGQLIIASAIVDDTIGWLIIAITIGIGLHGRVEPKALAITLLGVAVFLALSFTVGPRFVGSIIRWVNDRFESEFAVISTIIALVGMFALITDGLGVHTVLGAFVAGVLVGQSPILTKHIVEQLRGLIVALFMPLFFTATGLGADLTILRDPRLALLAGSLIVVASVGKFAGAFVGGRIAGITSRESLALGCGMNARGSTEVIVASIGLSIGALSRDLFSMIVAMAVVTTMAMPPTLRWALRRIPLSKAERERIERENDDANSFLPGLERQLVAFDDSASGKLAASLAGWLAGSWKILTTSLHVPEVASGGAPIDTPPPTGKVARSQNAQHEEVLSAAHTAEQSQVEESDRSLDVDTVTAEPGESASEAIARESKKGFGLLVVGLDGSSKADGMPSDQLQHVAATFDGAMLVVRAGKAQADEPICRDMLVAISGTDYAMRAAEVAFALAKASRARVTVLYVSTAKERTGWLRQLGTRRSLAAHEVEIVEATQKLGLRRGLTPEIAVATHRSADQAILNQLRRGEHDTLVIGVTPRRSGRLYYGETATTILAKATTAVLLVKS